MERLIIDLRPGLLDDLGLIPALHWQAADFQKRSGIKCRIHMKPGEVPLDEDRSTAVFRIFQEALTNIARHAKATEVNISLVAKADEMLLEIKDNGKGISKNRTSHSKSFGLIGMQERAYVFGGNVKVEGVRGKGTTVKVTIPVGTIFQEGGNDAG